MGYYSDRQTNRRPNKRGSWLWPVVIGIIVGASIMFVLYGLPIDQNEAKKDRESANTAENNDVLTGEKPLNVNVSTQITDVVGEVSDAVVGITNIQKRSDFWMEQETSEAGTGSGVIYKKNKKDAYIVTNHHVVEDADTLEVVLNNETSLDAELLGSDLFTDLAVLRVDADKVDSPIDLGSSANLKVGEPVIAIGNPLGHMFAGSVTQGIISGKQRTIPQDFNQDGQPDWQAEVLQTDAAINPGNSGGALINLDGQLIGINSMKISQEIAQGIGFAIPIDIARPIIDDLEESGTVKRPYLGVEIYSLEEVPRVEWKDTLQLPDDVDGGVYLWSVEPLSPAGKAGMKRLDVITKFDDKEINDIIDLRKVLYQEKKIGDKVDIVYYHNGEKLKTTLILGDQHE